jgi:hypothetical protein
MMAMERKDLTVSSIVRRMRLILHAKCHSGTVFFQHAKSRLSNIVTNLPRAAWCSGHRLHQDQIAMGSNARQGTICWNFLH